MGNQFFSNWNRNRSMCSHGHFENSFKFRKHRRFRMLRNSKFKTYIKNIERNVGIFDATTVCIMMLYFFFVFSEYPISELHPTRFFPLRRIRVGYTELYTNIRSASDTVNQVIKMDQIWLSIFYGNYMHILSAHEKDERWRRKNTQTHKLFVECRNNFCWKWAKLVVNCTL